MIRLALDAGLRSYAQGLASAAAFLTGEGWEMVLDLCKEEVQRLDLVQLKEGHTSSVVRVEAWPAAGGAPLRLGLNVARDRAEAAVEQEANRRDLIEWSAREPASVAAVYGAGAGRCPWFGRELEVPVVAVQWLDGARELHVVRDRATPGQGLFVLVDEFRPGAGPVPGIAGTVLDENASDRVWQEVVALRTRLAAIDWAAGALEAPEVELNHGDVVGEAENGVVRCVLVAGSVPRWQGPIGAWPYAAALSSARDDATALARRIYWGKPDLALEAVRQGLAATGVPAGAVFSAASAITGDELVAALGLGEGEPTAWRLIEEVRALPVSD